MCTLCSRTGVLTGNGSKLPKRDLDKYNLQKEVLKSLFTVPERVEDQPRRIIRPMEPRTSRAFGSLVTEPLRDRPIDTRRIATSEVISDGKHIPSMLITHAVLHILGRLDCALQIIWFSAHLKS